MVSKLVEQENGVSGRADATVDRIDEMLSESNDSVQCDAPIVSPSPDIAETTWREVLNPVWQKLKASLIVKRRNIKTYCCVIAGLVATGFIPFPQRISCDTVCEPVMRRYVAAPFDARLVESHVKSGQPVEAGQILATLDGSELRSELASAKSKFDQASQRQMAALSSGDHSKSENERLEVEHLQREIDMLESRLEQLDIRSPIQGVVVSGDLERALGSPLSIGDSLFEIASLEGLVAEVAVPEREISFVGDSMPVSVVLDALPGRSQHSQIENIHLRNEIRNNESVYVAEVQLENPNGLLRPGMNGTAVIKAGYQPLGWLLFHRPFEAVTRWLGR